MMEDSPADTSWSGPLRFLLRAGAFLMLAPLAGGIAYSVWVMWGELGWRTTFDLTAKFVFILYCAYVLGWKAAIATGFLVAALMSLFRYRIVSLSASVLIGGAAGAWLIALDPMGINLEPDWWNAGFAAFASLFSTWVICIDRYLRPPEELQPTEP